MNKLGTQAVKVSHIAMAPSFTHEFMSSSGGDYTTTQSPPFSNRNDISKSLLTSISFSNGNLADLLAVDGTSDTYSEVNTELYYSDGSDIVFVGAKYAPHDEAINIANKNVILGKNLAKRLKRSSTQAALNVKLLVNTYERPHSTGTVPGKLTNVLENYENQLPGTMPDETTRDHTEPYVI
ncbi:hypothetical protein BT96DRAFT_942228 [Gymnopus androsaceus JB14]|uniref:Uncharacterized protein n=1 Tax=Gymnopus androsaceus JB14 TaxID=1447944 RepID=A0A6A4HEP9_9AGAR|nr:hypothetical protein BT96DRAFT_942228 [Gymnopus androsaceus JB14]